MKKLIRKNGAFSIKLEEEIPLPATSTEERELLVTFEQRLPGKRTVVYSSCSKRKEEKASKR